jgi:hypothetical protein
VGTAFGLGEVDGVGATGAGAMLLGRDAISVGVDGRPV